MLRCPICRKAVAPRLENPSFPFCSDRCKLIDLGKWIGGDYRIPGESADVADDQPFIPTDRDGDVS